MTSALAANTTYDWLGLSAIYDLSALRFPRLWGDVIFTFIIQHLRSILA